MIQIDVSDAIRTMENTVGRLTPRQFSQGIARALNHTAAKAQTAASRQIRAVYNIRAKDVRAAMRRIRARFNNLTARIEITGAPLPLIAFGARQVKRGVSVQVLNGQRKVVNRAFIQTMPNGHKGVFARGNYGGGRFAFRSKRVSQKGNDLPITELMSVAVPQTLSKESVMSAIARGVERDFPDRLQHELSRMLAGLPATPDTPSPL